MGNIKSKDKNGKFKVVATSEATGIVVRNPKLLDEDKTHDSVENVLIKQQDEIATLKGNVSWLAKNGGGGSGGGGGIVGPSITEAVATILVNDLESGNKVILNESGLTIFFKDISIQAEKYWDVNISIGSIVIAKKQVNRTQNTIIIPYKDVILTADGKPTLSNHVGRLTINASYEDDANSLYGNAYWSGEILEAVISLEVSDVKVDLDDNGSPTENKYITVSYSAGITGSYTLNMVCSQGTQVYNKSIPINISNTNTNTVPVSIAELIDNVQPGEYKVQSTLSNDADSTITKTVVSTINFISTNLIISSATMSAEQSSPKEVSISASLNLVWSCYGQGTATFNYDYIINGNTVVKGNVGSVGQTISDVIPLIGASWATVGAVLPVTIRVYTGDKETTRIYYFKIVEATGTFIDHVPDVVARRMLDFKAFEYNTGTQTFNFNNPDYAQGGRVVGITSSISLINHSNLNGIQGTGATPPYLRFSNGCYGKLGTFTIGTNTYNINQMIANNNYEFTVNICFKSDYHPDNERSIFTLASFNNSGAATNSIEIGVHNVYVNGVSVVELVDNTYTDVTITSTKIDIPYINNNGQLVNSSRWVIKVFVEGTLSAISTLNNSAAVSSNTVAYFAGKPNPDGTSEGVYLCDCNIYSFSIYNGVLNDADILVNYINNKILYNYDSNGSFNFNIIGEEARKSFCEIDNNNNLTTEFYNRNADRYSIDFLVQNDKLNQNNLNAYAKVLGIPIVLIDVSSVAQWTFNNFILQQSAGDVSLSTATGQTMQYYDPIGQNNTVLTLNNVDVALQGTSTLKDAVKNINITLPATQEDTTVFIPKATWLPEQTYTLKADVVDSSHSNNAAIGKFINEVIDDYFDYSPDALANITESNYCKNQQPSATLKHTVEGFPVLLIMKFRTENVSDVSITPLGIYNFNLGRDAYRNLGFKKVNTIKKDGQNIQVTSFPYLAEHCVVDEEESNANWIEVKDTYSVPDLCRITTNVIPSKFDTSSGDFWQTAPNILNLLYEVRYGNYPNPADYNNFKNFVEFITNLPIEAPIKVTDRVGTKNVSMISGEYDAYDYINGGYIKSGSKLQMTLDANSLPDYAFNPLALYKYFVIANLFGLVDNFGKNSTYRSWNNGKYYIGFYDMDTALGGDNQGELTIQPDVWNKFFKNNIIAGKQYGWFEESYNSKEDIKNNGVVEIAGDKLIIGGGGISARANKIWLSIDTNVARNKFELNTGENGLDVGSQYAYQYKLLMEYLTEKAIAAGYTNFSDFFIEEYYKKQCGSCGPLLFNLDYRLKYLLQFKSNSYEELKYTSKLHGRKEAYTKYWLDNRITFLDSWFAFKRDSQTYNRPNDYQTTADIKYYNTPDTVPVKFNTPLLFKFEVGDASKSWYYAPANTEVYVDAGSNTSNSVLTGLINNSPQLLQIGNNNIPLSVMNVNLMNGAANANNLNKIGFPLFIELNLSNDEKLSASFNLNAFVDKMDIKPSELRVVNFANTACVTKGSKFDLELYESNSTPDDTKFSKLRSINISNSSCISKCYIPAIPLRELNITNSSIEELTLKNQNYLTYVDITGCNQINKVEIDQCPLYTHFTIDNNFNLRELIITNNESIKSITVTNCNNLSKVAIQNCPNLTSIRITPKVETGVARLLTGTGDSYLVLRDLPKLDSLTLTNNPIVTFEISKCNQANLRTLNLGYTALTHITGDGAQTTIPYDGGTDPYLDLYAFKKAVVNFQGCSHIVHLQFANEPTPVTVNCIFSTCTRMKRFYGNVKFTNANKLFMQCPNLSFHGRGNAGKGAGTWKGKSYISGNMVATPWEIIKGRTVFSDVNKSFDEFDDINIDDFYQSGRNVTNFRFDGNSQFHEVCRNIHLTQFDLYYILAVIALTSTTANGRSMFNWSFHVDTSNYPLPNGWNYLFDQINNPINRTMFVRSRYNLDNLRITTNNARKPVIPNPKQRTEANGEVTILEDNGLFSPCTESTNYVVLFNNQIIYNRTTFRRKTGNYKFTSIGYFYGIFGNQENNSHADIFKNMPDLKTIYTSFIGVDGNKLVDWSTLKFPETLQELYSSFKQNGENKLNLSTALNCPNLTKLYSCFTGTGEIDITSDMFSKYPKLEYLGDYPSSSIYDKTLYNFKDFTKNIAQATFPYDIFANNPKLKTVDGLFANVQNREYTVAPALPGALFDNTPLLESATRLFYNFNTPFTLTPNSFANCPNLKRVNSMFQQDLTKYRRLGPTGEIPYRLLYHGHTDTTKTLTTITTVQYNTLVGQVNEKVTETINRETITRPKNATEIHNTIKNFLTANSVKKNYTYYRFNKNIEDCSHLFDGCVNLKSYNNRDNQNPLIPSPLKEGEIGQYYLSASANTSKYVLSDLIEVTEETAYDSYALGETGNLDSDQYKPTYISNTKIKYTKDRTQGQYTTSGKNNVLNYICPRDLLYYCKSNCSIPYVFANQGLAHVDINLNSGEKRFAVGISGTIPADLLASVTDTTDFSNFFYMATNISLFHKGDKNYFIDPEFFTYAPNINNLCQAFSWVFFDGGVNLEVFSPLKQNLNIGAAFAACTFENGSSKTNISGIFKNNTISLITGVFSLNEMSVNIDNKGVYTISAGRQTTNSPNTATFTDNFTASKLPPSRSYVYYLQTTANVSDPNISNENHNYA